MKLVFNHYSRSNMVFYRFVHDSGDFYDCLSNLLPHHIRRSFDIQNYQKIKCDLQRPIYWVVSTDIHGNLVIPNFFENFQDSIKEKIRDLSFNLPPMGTILPIGLALEIPMAQENIKLVAVATRMNSDDNISTTKNTYFATKAVLRYLAKKPTAVGTELIIHPIGFYEGMTMAQVASQMSDAFNEKNKTAPDFEEIMKKQGNQLK